MIPSLRPYFYGCLSGHSRETFFSFKDSYGRLGPLDISEQSSLLTTSLKSFLPCKLECEHLLGGGIHFSPYISLVSTARYKIGYMFFIK